MSHTLWGVARRFYVPARVSGRMQLPGIVASELGAGEDVAAEVELGGDDRLLVTAERTLVYRAGGVLSDESVESFAHGAERLTVSEGRRKATITFEYRGGADRELAVPLDRLEDALQPVMAAVLRESGATDAGERVHRVFSFSELTLVVTDERLLKHVGTTLWDEDHESIPYDAVTDLDYEEGSVATGVVITVAGRVERLKTPNDRLREVRDHLESALLAARDADSIDDLGDDDEDLTEAEHDGDLTDTTAVADIGGVDALDAGSEFASAADVQDSADEGGAGDSDGEEAADPADPEDTADDGEATTDKPDDDPAETGTDDEDGEDTGGDETAEGGDASDDTDSDETAPDTGDAAGEGAAPGDDTDGTAGNETGDGDGTATAGSDGDTPFTESFEPATGGVSDELEELREVVERQNELLKRHNEAIERLVETLRGD